MICNCTCNAYFSVDKYRSIMTAISVESYSSENATAGQEAAARLLNDALDVNRMQQRSSLNRYAASQRDGGMSRDADYYSNVSGSLAQAFSIVGSRPSAQLFINYGGASMLLVIQQAAYPWRQEIRCR